MTHWKKLTNPDYLGAYALENGQDVILTIKSIQEEMVTGTDGKKDTCVVARFSERVKPMILNSTNMKTIAKLYKSNFIEDWVGKKIQIGIENVKAFGEVVEALRVRKFIPQVADPINCEMCQGKIGTTKNMTSEQLAQYTKSKYGKKLCANCATKVAEEMKKNGTE